MEIGNVIEVLHKVHESIRSIQQILQGLEMLTPETEKIAISLLKGEVPLAWVSLWDGPETPNLWIRAVTRKAHALKNWMMKV